MRCCNGAGPLTRMAAQGFRRRVRTLLNLFRPKPAIKAGEAVLAVSSSAEHEPTAGLILIDIDVAAGEAGEGPAELSVSVQGAGPSYRKAVELGAPRRAWVAVHGHLLPDGPAQVVVALSRAGRTLAERRIAVKARNEGRLAAAVADSLRAAGVPLIVDVLDAATYDYDDPKLVAWFDRSPEEVEAHLAELARAGRAAPDEIAALRQFVETGYLVLEGVVPPAELKRLNEALDQAVERKIEGYEWGSSQRIRNLHLEFPAVRDLWLNPKVLKVLELIFDAPPAPCQSLSYVFGSQQDHHQDTIHLTPFPAGMMCGVWTALEDVQEGSGELAVYPGSHRLPRVYMSSVGLKKVEDEDWTDFGATVIPRWTEMLAEKGLQPDVYRPKAGTVLIWHENLMHAGSVRLNPEKSRRSIVCHYFARGAVAYYDSSGMPGITYQGPLRNH